MRMENFIVHVDKHTNDGIIMLTN